MARGQTKANNLSKSYAPHDLHQLLGQLLNEDQRASAIQRGLFCLHQRANEDVGIVQILA